MKKLIANESKDEGAYILRLHGHFPIRRYDNIVGVLQLARWLTSLMQYKRNEEKYLAACNDTKLCNLLLIYYSLITFYCTQ